MTEQKLIDMPMPEVKRYLAVGPMMPVDVGAGAGVFVAAADFDRIAAQKVAAVGLPERREPDWAVPGGVAKSEGFNECLDAVEPLVAGLRAEVERLKQVARDAAEAEEKLINSLVDERTVVCEENNELRDQNAELIGLLRHIRDDDLPVGEYDQRIDAALSAYEATKA